MTIYSQTTCSHLNNLDIGKVSTTYTILQCTEYVRAELDKEPVCGAFLVLSKAFDSISH